MTSLTYRRTIIINRYSGRIGKVTFAAGIESNDSVNVPMVQEFVSGVIVACGVGDERVDSQVGVHITELGEGNNGRNAVMPSGFDEAQI